MIITNRPFTRREPIRNAKSIYIFCEGKKREYQYFRYFKGIDSRINIEVYLLEGNENNSPTGLYDIAQTCLIKSDENPFPKYELLEIDEVWFVIDTDKWGDKIQELRRLCGPMSDWKIAQSNPCFEVWLYYHCFDTEFLSQQNEICDTWRAYLSDSLAGGFDTKKHAIQISRAIFNAENFFMQTVEGLEIGSTEVFRLAKVIYSVSPEKIDAIFHRRGPVG